MLSCTPYFSNICSSERKSKIGLYIWKCVLEKMFLCEIFPRNKSYLAFLTRYIHNIRTYTSCRSEDEFHMACFAGPKIGSGWLKTNTVLLKRTWCIVDFCLNLQHNTEELVLHLYLHLILFDCSCFHLHSFLSSYYVTACCIFCKFSVDQISLLQQSPLQHPLLQRMVPLPFL